LRQKINTSNDMTEIELDNWFCSLTVKQKEHIACKVLLKQERDPKAGIYPNCADVWMSLDEDIKDKIHDHCTDKHGMWIQEGGDAPIFSY